MANGASSMAGIPAKGIPSLTISPTNTSSEGMTESRSANPSLPQPDESAKLAADTANLRNVFETKMEGLGVVGKPHQRAALLTIAWSEELDDLKTTAEVNDLENVFRDLYGYDIRTAKLKASPLPLLQLQQHISNFLVEFDSSSTLLIVYYAGHGTRNDKANEGLRLLGNSTPKQKHSIRDSIPWMDVENLFQHAEADLLLIFDCCYAGSMIKASRSYWSTRSFEYLAACTANKRTYFPGPESFTTALIWSLKTLVRTRPAGFTTSELQLTIMRDAPGFPDQHVPLTERTGACDQRLIIAPLTKEDHSQSRDLTTAFLKSEEPKIFLDLRFYYESYPDDNEIGKLAAALRKLISREDIKARRIGWIRLEKKQMMDVVAIAKHWKKRSSERRSSSLNKALIPQSPDPLSDLATLQNAERIILASTEAAAEKRYLMRRACPTGISRFRLLEHTGIPPAISHLLAASIVALASYVCFKDLIGPAI